MSVVGWRIRWNSYAQTFVSEEKRRKKGGEIYLSIFHLINCSCSCVDFLLLSPIVSQYPPLLTSFNSSLPTRVCSSCKSPLHTQISFNYGEGGRQLKEAKDLLSLQSSMPPRPLSIPDSHPSFPLIDKSIHPPPYHLFSWVCSHSHLLAPPVGNKMIHSRGTQFKVMIVGGPNQRTDYHIEDGEEWFVQLRGDMVLKIVDQQGKVFKDIPIKEGESFLLPANVPHSPQRLENTVGLVIERERFTYELDGLRWYCCNQQCRQILHTFSFRCEDLGTQLKILIGYWYDDAQKEMRTCKSCGTVETKPATISKIKTFAH